MNISDILLEFRKTQNITLLECTNMNISNEDLNVISIEILSWLKLEYKRTLWKKEGRHISLKPLHLTFTYSWCNSLTELMGSDNIFSQVFEITDRNLDFKSELEEEYMMTARRTAFEKYNPSKIV